MIYVYRIIGCKNNKNIRETAFISRYLKFTVITDSILPDVGLTFFIHQLGEVVQSLFVVHG